MTGPVDAVVVTPDVLDEVARAGAGSPGVLDGAADAVTRVAPWPGAGRVAPLVDAVVGLRTLAADCRRLDRWLRSVAAAVRCADTPTGALATRLLALGVDHPTAALVRWSAHAVAGRRWDTVEWWRVADDELATMLRWAELPTTARDVVGRVLLGRWAARVEQAVARRRGELALVDSGLLDRAASLVDAVLLDPLDRLVRLHVDAHEQLADLEQVAAGLRDLAERDDVTVLDVRLPVGVLGSPVVPPPTSPHPAPDGSGGATIGPPTVRGDLAVPTVRLALGDPATATHLAVLVPGTGTGVGRHGLVLRDARALHEALAARAAGGDHVATVVELYDAPADLGAAAATGPARVAATELAAALPVLRHNHQQRVTVVGHSYGAVVAGHLAAAGAPLDALVALGAPGLGVATTAALGLPPDAVWAGRARGDPIALAADLDEITRALDLDPSHPLRDPLAGHGPDPVDADFGARRLPTAGALGDEVTGHLDYLRPGSASVAAVAEVVLGRDPR